MWKSNEEYKNRQGYGYKFILKDENRYTFTMNDQFSTDFALYSWDDDEVVQSYDPSGGPFIELGMTVDGKEITYLEPVYYGCLIGVKDE